MNFICKAEYTARRIPNKQMDKCPLLNNFSSKQHKHRKCKHVKLQMDIWCLAVSVTLADAWVLVVIFLYQSIILCCSLALRKTSNGRVHEGPWLCSGLNSSQAALLHQSSYKINTYWWKALNVTAVTHFQKKPNMNFNQHNKTKSNIMVQRFISWGFN